MSENIYTIITNGVIQNPGEKPTRGNILIKNNKIVDISECHPALDAGSKLIDAHGCIITPGLIDQHLHGGYGCNFNTADVDTIVNFLCQLPKHGVTAICPAIMTDELPKIKAQIEKIKQVKEKLPANAAEIIGINLEGPFINPDYKGAHPKELFLEPNTANYQQIESDEIKIMTLAPELDNGLVAYLKDRGVIISAGHSNAEDIDSVDQVTHIFNAMTPLHHRKPGIIGKSLINDTVSVEVIADHNHLHPDIIDLILRCKPKDKVIFISDSLPLNQSTEDSAVFGGQKIFKQGDAAINEEGNFAGSLLFLDSIIKKNKDTIALKDLISFCSLNPAQNLGLNDRGYIKKGMKADLVLWNHDTLEVQEVIN